MAGFISKIGGDPVDIPLETEARFALVQAAGGNGRRRITSSSGMKALHTRISRIAGIHPQILRASFTPTGYPAIGWTSEPSIAVMAGGRGAAPKSSDEIGRLGAELLLHGRIIDHGYRADFEPHF